MARRWQWETRDSLWSVELDEARGMLRWTGEDKPRPGVRGSELAGGCVDQGIEDLLERRRGPYECPRTILDEIIVAAALC